jgi:hypothetical protein
MKIAVFIQALELVGRTYRNKDGSQPAEAVRKIRQQLEGASDMTLAEWAEAKQSASKQKFKRPAKAKTDEEQVREALRSLEQAKTQTALSAMIGSLELSAGEWQAVLKKLTGRSAKSGKAAQVLVETYFSDRLLLDERVESVKRQFRGAIPPPADA